MFRQCAKKYGAPVTLRYVRRYVRRYVGGCPKDFCTENGPGKREAVR